MSRGRQRYRTNRGGYRHCNVQAGATPINRHDDRSTGRAFRNNSIHTSHPGGYHNTDSNIRRRSGSRSYQPSRNQERDHSIPPRNHPATPLLQRRRYSAPTLTSDYAISTRRTHSEYVERIRDLFRQGTALNKKLQRLLHDLSWFQPDADEMDWEGTTTMVFVRDLAPLIPSPWNDVGWTGLSRIPLALTDAS